MFERSVVSIYYTMAKAEEAVHTLSAPDSPSIGMDGLVELALGCADQPGGDCNGAGLLKCGSFCTTAQRPEALRGPSRAVRETMYKVYRTADVGVPLQAPGAGVSVPRGVEQHRGTTCTRSGQQGASQAGDRLAASSAGQPLARGMQGTSGWHDLWRAGQTRPPRYGLPASGRDFSCLTGAIFTVMLL